MEVLVFVVVGGGGGRRKGEEGEGGRVVMGMGGLADPTNLFRNRFAGCQEKKHKSLTYVHLL